VPVQSINAEYRPSIMGTRGHCRYRPTVSRSTTSLAFPLCRTPAHRAAVSAYPRATLLRLARYCFRGAFLRLALPVPGRCLTLPPRRAGLSTLIFALFDRSNADVQRAAGLESRELTTFLTKKNAKRAVQLFSRPGLCGRYANEAASGAT
jgi:hypothetical protein